MSSAFAKVSMQELIRIDISLSIRPMITKFGKQVHLQDFTQMRVIKQVLVMLLRQQYMTN